MLAEGDLAPDFPVTLADGSTRPFSAYRGRAVILYFFPKANTSGCTTETRGFSERYGEFQRAGVEVIGVSVDPPATQAGFAEKCNAKFPVVGDPSKETARKYGVLGFLGLTKRVTFFVDAQGRIRKVVEGLLPNPHLRAAEDWVAHPPSP